MKTVIRKSTFETNSSSMHSLAILPEEKGKMEKYEDMYVEDERFVLDDDGYLHIDDTEDLDFGWGFDILTSVYEKMCYAIASTHDIERITEIIKEKVPQLKGIVLPYVEDDWCSDENNNYFGYIDHDSVGTLSPRLTDKEISDFIFEEKNYAIIDNDNSSHTEQVERENCKTKEELLDFYKNRFDERDDYDLYHSDYDDYDER